MNVSDAVAQRKSIRNYLDKPVDSSLLQQLMEKAARAPSGGNLQPWHVYVLNGQRMTDFHSHLEASNSREQPAYDIYPANLQEPYRSRRFKVGEDMYALLGIPREDNQPVLPIWLATLPFLEHRQASSATSTKRWDHLNGLIWVCSCRPSCCWHKRPGLPPVRRKPGRLVRRRWVHLLTHPQNKCCSVVWRWGMPILRLP